MISQLPASHAEGGGAYLKTSVVGPVRFFLILRGRHGVHAGIRLTPLQAHRLCAEHGLRRGCLSEHQSYGDKMCLKQRTDPQAAPAPPTFHHLGMGIQQRVQVLDPCSLGLLPMLGLCLRAKERGGSKREQAQQLAAVLIASHMSSSILPNHPHFHSVTLLPC